MTRYRPAEPRNPVARALHRLAGAINPRISDPSGPWQSRWDERRFARRHNAALRRRRRLRASRGLVVIAVLVLLLPACRSGRRGGGGGGKIAPEWVTLQTQHGGPWHVWVDTRCQKSNPTDEGFEPALAAQSIDEALGRILSTAGAPAVEKARTVLIDFTWYRGGDGLARQGDVYTDIRAGKPVIFVPCSERGTSLYDGIRHDLCCHGLPAALDARTTNVWASTCHPTGHNPGGYPWIGGACR